MVNALAVGRWFIRARAGRGIAALILGSVGASGAARAHEPTALDTSDASYSQLVRLEHEMIEAFRRNDTATMNRVIGEDFILTSATSAGDLISKRAYIDGGPAAIRVESFRFHDFRIRLLGRDVAVVHCRIDWRSTWNGKRWDADFLMTDLWARRAGRWQIVARHSSYPGTRPRA